MKRILTALTMTAAMATSVMADNATATIHVNQGNQKIHKEIYGQFAEHLGSCIYGGLWVGETSQSPNI
ncbi:MAG: alpha-N-arabinofuranosidase, partial [Prevotella sp.]|nr:alpha-N-arabinofuranosidase [Prevotella sp.]